MNAQAVGYVTTNVIMRGSILRNRPIRKFLVFSSLRVLTNSEFTKARYWAPAQAKLIPNILSLRIYSDFWLLLIVSPSVATSQKLIPSFKITNKIILCITYLCCSCYMTGPWLCPWHYHVYLLNLWLIDASSVSTRNICVFCPHSVFIWFERISERRVNISLRH